jgi:hypothetical protein
MALSSDDAHTLKAYLDGVDHVAKEAEAEWGMDRLPLLVDAELRAKFYRQQERWRTALDAAYTAKVLTRGLLEDVAKKSGAMQRAWEALIAAATEAGHRPIKPWVWEAKLRDGTVAAFVQSTAEVSEGARRGPLRGRLHAGRDRQRHRRHPRHARDGEARIPRREDPGPG